MKKIHLAAGNDNLRPAQTYIKVTPEYSYATDSFIAVKIPTKEILNILVDREFYILAKDWAKFKFFNAVTFTKDGINLTGYDKKNERLGVIEIKYPESFGYNFKFPNVEMVLGEREHVETKQISINFELFSRVNQALGTCFHALNIYEKTQPIKLTPTKASINKNCNGIGLIMPIMFEN
jgi:hypothetical protein